MVVATSGYLAVFMDKILGLFGKKLFTQDLEYFDSKIQFVVQDFIAESSVFVIYSFSLLDSPRGLIHLSATGCGLFPGLFCHVAEDQRMNLFIRFIILFLSKAVTFVVIGFILKKRKDEALLKYKATSETSTSNSVMVEKHLKHNFLLLMLGAFVGTFQSIYQVLCISFMIILTYLLYKAPQVLPYRLAVIQG
jgi:hypothetical protein